MRVKFYIGADESSEYEFPDDTPDSELQEAAYQWVNDNVTVEYEILEEEDC